MTMIRVCVFTVLYFLLFQFFLKILFIFRERGRERGRETSMCFLSRTPYWGPGPQPRRVPWLGISWQPFGSQGGTQSTEPHQPGLLCITLECTLSNYKKYVCCKTVLCYADSSLIHLASSLYCIIFVCAWFNLVLLHTVTCCAGL